MDKVLVDRELLSRAADVLGSQSFSAWDEIAEQLRAFIAQPAEAEGVAVVGVVCVSRFKNNPAVENVEFHLAADLPQGQNEVVLHSAHLAALSAVTAERDNYKSWYDDAMDASNIAGFAGMSAAQVIDYQDKEIMRLRAELEMLRDNNRKAAISDAAMAAKEG